MLARAQREIAAGNNQYAPAVGVRSLREAVAEQRADRYGTGFDPDTEVVVTAGATEAITAAVLAFCRPGDEVVVFEPYYDSYAAATVMAGATRRAVPLRYTEGEFRFDPDELTAAFSDRTRVLIMNTPHNPTGKVFTAEELATIAELCRRHDVLIVSDEVYEYLTYDGVRHVPVATSAPERTLSVSGLGKTFSATGWRVGWACGPAELVAAVTSVKQYASFTAATPFQLAAVTALRECMDWVEELRRSLTVRRDLLSGALREAGIEVYPTSGSYFLQADARSFGTDDGMALCLDLPERAGVVAVPSVAFFDHPEAGRHLVRLAFCKDEATLIEGAKRLVGYRDAVA
ncbi:pyridoxal phosphate-dependent aminotransferase [Stackebrandtia albiflava]